MMIELFIRGLIFGLAIAAPVGPIGLLCIRRTITDGRLVGFVSGLGAATADALYGSVAALGLQALSSLIFSLNAALQIVGGMALIWIGLTTMIARPVPVSIEPTPTRRRLLSAYFSTLLLTLANPATILIFTVIFAGLGTVGKGGMGLVLVVGVACGSALWWTLLSGGVSLMRQRVTVPVLRLINLVSGLVIIGFGVTALLSRDM
jgi:threonine/homoserine/homoserine lactone efflux protein